MITPAHHPHLRKRIYLKLEKYPSPNPVRRYMDYALYVIGIFGPLFTVPQVLQIWVNKDATGVSLITWLSYFLFSIFWTFYGYVHDEYPIIISSTLSLIVQGVIIAGILFYQ